MEIEDLINLGFNKNESIVYLSLIKFGISEASAIIKDTKFHKNIVYDNLEKLIDKGLVTYIIEGGIKKFKTANPKTLIQLFEEEQKILEGKKILAKKISEEINKTINSKKEKSSAAIYRGIKGIKSFYESTLEEVDYVVFGAPEKSIKIMGEIFWKNYTIKRIDKNIKVKMIFNNTIKSFGEKIKNNKTLIKYFDKEFEPLTETHIQKDKVAIIVWNDEPTLILIQDKTVADSYIKYFNKMWKESKK